MNTDHPNEDVNKVISTTLAWLDAVIINEQFCPFAKPVRDNNQIHFAVAQQSDTASLLRQVIAECDNLMRHDKVETSLLIYTAALGDFDDYLDFLDMANELLENAGYEGVLQLASFHPQYVFDGEPASCPSHYTNRSPYPMLHILREDSISQALISFASPESIPQRNIAHAKALGRAFFLPFVHHTTDKK
ncbi:DUF1415 domain-containing protein [Glaciecola siphonariae]|uniref:DUF1415 domain-containing protein n=1 Tax=Glaciecola siphonariae TaxID=521012 RepID=A0ABV9M1E6_9ALTE